MHADTHNAPSWIHGLGVLAACVGLLIEMRHTSAIEEHQNAIDSRQVGAQAEAQRNSERSEEHLRQAQQRIWDSINSDRLEQARKFDHVRETLRAEILGDLRREIDQCGCRRPTAGGINE